MVFAPYLRRFSMTVKARNFSGPCPKIAYLLLVKLFTQHTLTFAASHTHIGRTLRRHNILQPLRVRCIYICDQLENLNGICPSRMIVRGPKKCFIIIHKSVVLAIEYTTIHISYPVSTSISAIVANHVIYKVRIGTRRPNFYTESLMVLCNKVVSEINSDKTKIKTYLGE